MRLSVSGITKKASQGQGFLTNLNSCYALLMVALSKAFSDGSSMESGLADFQRATWMLGRLNAQLSLECV
ncbi:hypothetical protein, partial [Metapseudomonas otitidis]|uniref:hypothetical protein n=1 Tax=Metapseudomonas otitidis TaxID=319939 RepID=UPI001F2FE9D4